MLCFNSDIFSLTSSTFESPIAFKSFSVFELNLFDISFKIVVKTVWINARSTKYFSRSLESNSASSSCVLDSTVCEDS